MGGTKVTCRWAALSLSSIAEVFLRDILLPRDQSETVEHRLAAVSSTKTKTEAQQWLQKIDGVDVDAIEFYQDWAEMLQNADFDIVYISTPHPLHYRQALAAIEAKSNVLVEKPATMNAAQFSKLSDFAESQGVVVMEAMWTRYLPAARHLQEELLPRIGQVKRVFADFSFPIVSPDLPYSSRFLDKGAGAGSLLDQGVYALTWADIGLHGSGTSDDIDTKVVYADCMNVPNVPGGVDDTDTIILSKQAQAAQQAVAIVTTSMTFPGSSKPPFYRRLQAVKSAPSVRIEATKASVAIPFPPIRPEELHLIWYDEQSVGKDGMETIEIIKKPIERGWGLWYQADVIARKVASREKWSKGEVIGRNETYRVLRLMDEARERAGISYSDELEQL